MVNVIFNLLFEKNKKTKCITIIKKRAVNKKYDLIESNQKKQVVKTCLSKYFEERKGLKVKKEEKLSTKLSADLVGDNSRNLSASIMDRRFREIF